MPDKSYYLLLQSMLKVISFFGVQFQFDKNGVTYLCIKCNRFNKTVTCQFSETVTIYILPVLSKLLCFVMLVYPGLYKPRSNTYSLLKNILLNGVQEDHVFMKQLFRTYMDPYLSNSLSLLVKIDVTQCVACMPTTNKIINQLMQQTLVVEGPYQNILQHILLFLFVPVLNS